MNAFRDVHHRRFVHNDYVKKTTSPPSINSKPRKARQQKRDSPTVTAEKEEMLQKQQEKTTNMATALQNAGIPVDLLLFLHNSAVGDNNLGSYLSR